MNIENVLKTTVIPGAIASAAVLLSLYVPITLDSIIGFGSVIIVAGIAALEYRLTFKKLLGR
jgi:hypothetical protein